MAEKSRLVSPTLDEPTIAGGSEVLGGALGRRARVLANWWTPARVSVAIALVAFAFGYFLKAPCLIRGWGGVTRYSHLCYSDIPPLYQLRGFADGYFPYLQHAPHAQPLEYPVLTGMFMLLAAWLTPVGGATVLWFYDINVVLLGLCLFVAVAATSLTVRRRPWDALLVALAPGVVLAGTINWDLLAVALTAASLAAWSHRRLHWSGALLGLAIAAKFYPIVLVAAVAVLCLRSGQLRAFARWTVALVVAWLLVNLPFMVLAPAGWSYFYRFSATRGQDFGSVWLALSIAGVHIPASILNELVTLLLAALVVAIMVLALRIARRPRLAQVSFLLVAAFILINKVYSPQYVLWLIPLAVLARPRWRDFMIWQLFETAYFVAIWWYLVWLDDPNKGLPGGWYAVAIAGHLGGTIWFGGRILRDMRHPVLDPIRDDGEDDPGGGVLDRTADRFTLHRSRAAASIEVDDDRSMV